MFRFSLRAPGTRTHTCCSRSSRSGRPRTLHGVPSSSRSHGARLEGKRLRKSRRSARARRRPLRSGFLQIRSQSAMMSPLQTLVTRGTDGNRGPSTSAHLLMWRFLRLSPSGLGNHFELLHAHDIPSDRRRGLTAQAACQDAASSHRLLALPERDRDCTVAVASQEELRIFESLRLADAGYCAVEVRPRFFPPVLRYLVDADSR